MENPLSTRLLSGDLEPGDLIVIDEVANELVFERQIDASTDFIERPDTVEYTQDEPADQYSEVDHYDE